MEQVGDCSVNSRSIGIPKIQEVGQDITNSPIEHIGIWIAASAVAFQMRNLQCQTETCILHIRFCQNVHHCSFSPYRTAIFGAELTLVSNSKSGDLVSCKTAIVSGRFLALLFYIVFHLLQQTFTNAFEKRGWMNYELLHYHSTPSIIKKPVTKKSCGTSTL